ncbi:hypothetical protein [Actinacidiphila sp. bgisy144]|uniref:hypothetical protein n=1 Tax=Actinacidiphila sp. bgisy144 TaxID=3413791 RepID=UPI003EB811CB
MPPSEARIVDICTRLTAVGLRPERTDDGDGARIEALVPADFPMGSWPELLAVLETADRFGFADSTSRGRQLGAVVRTAPGPARHASPGTP